MIIKKHLLLICISAAFLAACTQEKTPTVGQYLHDLDAANAAVKKYSNDPAKYQGNADWMNASAALSKIQFLNDCWPKLDAKRFSTANTNHACLDSKGHTR